MNDLQTPLYFDFAASTPVDVEVAAAMQQVLETVYANPSAKSHRYGWQADQLIQQAKASIAGALHCNPNELIVTSGATEADNMALQGVIFHRLREPECPSPLHVVSSAVEHKAVLSLLQAMEAQFDVEVTYLAPSVAGCITVDSVVKAIRPNTRVVSLMHVNNELGGVTDVAAIACRLRSDLRSKNLVFHVDAAQSLGKIPVNLDEMGADFVSFSAHKCYGPKGVGALFIRQCARARVAPLYYGGEQEWGLRPGTVATHQIIGFAKAVVLAVERLPEDLQRLNHLNADLVTGLEKVDGVRVHSSVEVGVPHIVHFTVDNIKDADILLLALNDLAVGTGSACNSVRVEPSYVLKALGVPREEAMTGIRLSMGRQTTSQQVRHCVAHIAEVVSRLRGV